MSTFKKAKIVILPTNEVKGDFSKERIYPCLLKHSWMFDKEGKGKLIFTDSNIRTPTQLQHLYIISDDEIKEGDVVKIPCGVGKVKELTWKFGNDNPSYIVEDIFIYKLRYGQKEGELQINSFRYEDVKKIIATTDVSLGLPQPSQQFIQKYIEEYNKGNIITDVLVEYENIYIDSFGTTIVQHEKDSDSYLKQCTFVNSKLKINPKDNTITIKKIKETYNKEELCQILEKYTSFLWSEVGIHYPISLGKDAKDKFINSKL